MNHKPVILAGHGVISANAQQEFYTFIERLGAPVLLTWKSIGLLDDNHPLYCGRPGAIGQRAANRILQECDQLLVLGAKMDLDQVAYQLDKIAPHANKYVFDIDKSELDKYDDYWSKNHSDIREYLNKNNLLAEAFCLNFDYSEWLSYCKFINTENPVFNPEWWNEKPVNYYCFIDELSRLSRNDDVIAPEASTAAQALFQSWKVKFGQKFTYAGALGAMGTGLPAAVGAALATGKRVLCPNGDGGFMLNIQELEVIKRLNLPVKFFVLDNEGYGAIMNTQQSYFGGHFVGSNEASGLTLPNIADIADAFGLRVDFIPDNMSIKRVLARVMKDDKPEVVIVSIPNDFKPVMRVGVKIVDGKPTSCDFGEV